MNTTPEYIDDLLVSYMLGEASPAERKEVEDWVAANGENQKYFDQFKAIWDESHNLASQRAVNENDAWERLLKRAQEDELTEVKPAPKGRTISFGGSNLMRIAAALVILIGLGSLLFIMNSGGSQIIARAGDTPIKQTLPDGSVITLNKNSTLAYSSKFDGKTRNVTLTGEAFFDIAPDKSKPFIIEANSTSITVVGTSFNVKTSSVETVVIVETGIVQVARNEKSVRVTPHQKATVVTASNELKTESTDEELYNYYRTNEFVCKGTPLSKLTEVLNEAYNTHITVKDSKLAATPITATFKNESLDNVLKVISETLSLTVERKGDSIYLNPAMK